jgi:hypothetical protein
MKTISRGLEDPSTRRLKRQDSPLRELDGEVVDPITSCQEGFVAVTGVGENPPEGGQVSSNNL